MIAWILTTLLFVSELAAFADPVRAPRDKGGAGGAVAPATWIGVRVSDVPEALAAHIGAQGLMIDNIVTGSPADQAGLQRFDVVVRFNDKPVNQLDDLLQAISAVSTGASASVTVLRGGREQTVSLTPTTRPATEDYGYKYDTPPDDAGYFGHALRRDALGNWLLEPLGRLNQLPDPLRTAPQTTAPAWRDWVDSVRGAQQDPFRLFFQSDPNDPQARMFFFPNDIDAPDAQVSLAVTVADGDGSVTIERAADGRIKVTRTAADGASSTREYEDAAALKADDAEAYSQLRRFTGMRAQRFITVPPDVDQLRRRQDEWRKSMTEALERSRRSLDVDQQRAVRALEEAQRRLYRSGQPAPPGGAARSESISRSLRLASDGRILISITRNGETTRYEFENRGQFEAEQPELFLEFRPLLDDEEGEPRGAVAPLLLTRAA